MKTMAVKNLHMGKCIEDLDKRTDIPDVRTKKLLSLLETAKLVLHEGEKYYREGDEELAYIFFMRYFNLVNSIHHKPDYSQHKQAVRQKLGNNNAHKLIMDKLEMLSQSLERRYNQLNDVKPINEVVTPVDTRRYEELNASEKFDRLKGGMISTKSPSGDLMKPLYSVTCAELFLRMKESNVLVMDCRSSSDYDTSHLLYAYSFNVPEELIVPGMSAGKLQDRLNNSAKELWSARRIKDYVVLMDWNCKDENPQENSHIAILRNILQNWDPDVTYRSPIQILEGGYDYFITMYPTLCTNPSVQAPQQSNENGDLIDDIEYPSIHDITMKDEIRERGFSLSPDLTISNIVNAYKHRPRIDRSSKWAAMRTYEEKKIPIVDIMKEQEQLLQKAQANDEQLEEASKKWATIFEQKHKGANKQELSGAEQELLYHIMQLESAAEDNKIENNRLKSELEEYKRQEREQKEQLTAKEQANLEQATKQIATKIEERQRLDELHEREKQEREKQLAIAREYKRHLKSPTSAQKKQITKDEEEEQQEEEEQETPLTPRTPQIPQFDRSVKPQLGGTVPPSTAPTTTRERRRDFSPLNGTVGRGLTGLKNLGNTCYMNSILQCLSNTPQLTEYCITDKYKNYISRDNKTKGLIVEEVAALIKVLWNGNYKCVASKDLRYVIGQYQQIFRGIEQQDSHEFLTILMDWLHCDLQTLHVPIKPRDNITASEKSWLEFTKSKESLILHLFYGQIKSTVKCVQCHKESATYECFSNLSLELPSNGDVCHLDQCMAMYFSGELIHGWNCPNCKQKRDAIKKLDISKLPPVLVVHLKRFYADPDAIGRNTYKKKQNYVRFPLENLDMTPFIAKSESRSVTPKTYQLYSVSNHYGSMESGHYTAFCKSGNYGRWFKFDDQVVTQLDTSNVVSSAAYILFYTWLPPIQISEIN